MDVSPRKSRAEKAFFIHVNVLSDLFKKKFLHYLKKAYEKNELKFVGQISSLANRSVFKAFINQLYSITWVTYCKRPFGGPKQVIEYLGRYTHRVAISNYRILKLEDGKVTFKWRDYRDNKEKLMTLDVFEFIRRFLSHVLPTGFTKIRYYGLLSSRNKAEKLTCCRQLLCVSRSEEPDYFENTSWQDLLFALMGINVRVCPACGKGRLVCHEIITANKLVPT